MEEKKAKSKKRFIGFNADIDVIQLIQRQNDIIYKRTGKSNQSAAINELLRAGAEKKGWR